MLSVFCSNTPECWKCTLRFPDFKIFPGGMPLDFPSNLRFRHLQVTPWVLSGTVPSFLYRQLQSFCHLLKTLLKTLLIAWYYIHLARSKSEIPRLKLCFHYILLETKIQCETEIAIKTRNQVKSTEISGPPCAFLICIVTSRVNDSKYMLFLCFVFLLCLYILYCMHLVLIVLFH